MEGEGMRSIHIKAYSEVIAADTWDTWGTNTVVFVPLLIILLKTLFSFLEYSISALLCVVGVNTVGSDLVLEVKLQSLRLYKV